MELISMLFAKGSQSMFHIIQMVDGFVNSPEDLLAVSADLGITRDATGIGKASETAEIPLCPGVHTE